MELLLLFFIVIVIWIYYHFNGRIKELEEEVSRLKGQNTNINLPFEKPVIPQEVKPEQQPIETSTTLQPEFVVKPEPPKPSLDEKITPKEPNVFEGKLEQLMSFLKQNALSVIGIFTLVLGIGYFVKYAIDRNWIGESGRVAIGMITGGILLGIGHWLRKNFSIFGSIITGGGISVFYLTITIAFQEYGMFSQNVAFGILAIITLASVLLANFYKSEVLNIVALIGGFLAPILVSTGQSNYLFLFSYLSILNIGMLVIAFLRNWKSLGWLAFTFTSIYFLTWIIDAPSTKIIYFIILSYLIFYAFALQNYFKTKIISTAEILLLVFINIFAVLGGIYVLWSENIKGFSLLPIGFAIINALLIFRDKKADTKSLNFAVFTGIAISLATIAVALELETYFVTIIWAIEASLLLFIWKKTEQKIFKQCFNILFPILIISQIYTWSNYFSESHLAVIFNPIFLTSLVVIASFLFNLFYIKNLSEDVDDQSRFQYVKFFSGLSYVVIYFSISFEIWYHIQNQSDTFISCIILVYTIYYLFAMLLLRQKLNYQPTFVNILIGLLFLFALIHVSVTDINFSIFKHEVSKSFYLIYLLYWIPVLVCLVGIIPKTSFLNEKLAYWAIGFVFVYLISFEIYHIYILLKLNQLKDYEWLQSHFIVLYLPIIWTILAASFIYYGLQKSKPEINKIGFVLIGITIAKLYLYDVWQLDNVSRIVAFILLGVLLLLSSFLFQRLKKIISKMVETKTENNED
ncbi:Predicted membrane protein [Soonwooa buanensis]|uniref:Predicted membrane protein n=1 Tax=Soonwooa buanensis TaxID=619805 RepID=A0A1T5F3Q2_9FLAO|nr:DUF2339 domain-containing protein [Soonwooa buanensis]SKB90658.1 Predicted membrane protein [Soonwooa buanensis]